MTLARPFIALKNSRDYFSLFSFTSHSYLLIYSRPYQFENKQYAKQVHETIVITHARYRSPDLCTPVS